jgi:hypothetical protein
MMFIALIQNFLPHTCIVFHSYTTTTKYLPKELVCQVTPFDQFGHYRSILGAAEQLPQLQIGGSSKCQLPNWW